MSYSCKFNLVGQLISAAVFGYQIYAYLKDSRERKEHDRKEVVLPDGLLFRPLSDDIPSDEQLKDCKSLDGLFELIQNCKHSMKLCMYIFKYDKLATAIINKHLSGVKVKIISDGSNSGEDCEIKGSQIARFRKAGIMVRLNKSKNWMHHKFLLIDNQVILTGSLNFTKQALNNYESLIISNTPKHVQPFIQEFEDLWELLNPEVRMGDVEDLS